MTPLPTPLVLTGALFLLTWAMGALDRIVRHIKQPIPRTNPKATTHDFRTGQAVTYVPPEAGNDANHPSCIDGYVAGINHPARIVFFRQHLTNDKTIAATPAQLL